MKTTVELPDELFAEAKAAAARRRTTLKAMIEHALRRELIGNEMGERERAGFRIDEHGLPVFQKDDGAPVTSDLIYAMMEELGV